MNKINPQDSESKSQDLVSENIEQLKQLFPEIVSDGKVDFEVLKEVLGEEVIEDEEYYKFTWAGKAQARREANKPSTGTLRPAKDESVDWDKTSNLYVEGDNLEVLKLMQKSYAGKVKMIYIDPPYNTGKDFVYKDNYKDNLKNYQELTGQVDSEGNKMTTNTESQGRFHSNWLNMMYPRLRLARNLLSDDGIIFMSIDEHEVENLKKIGNEIFGEENFLGNISNISNPKGRSDDKFIATSHEYIIVYSKFLSNVNFYGFAPDEKILRRYNKLDNDKKYREIDLRKTGDNDLREDRPNLFYYFLYNEKTNDFYATRDSEIPKDYRQIKPLRKDGEEGNWRWGIENSNSNINKLEPKFMPSRKVWSVFEKDYLKDRGLVKPTSSWNFKDVNSERGSETFINLNFDKRIFPKPKPIGTIIRVLKVGTDENDLILDFFSGSASTAHAVMSLNSIDGKNRKHIQVQLPEPTDEKSEAYKAGYKTLTEIGKERIRRAGKQIIEDLEQQIQAQEEKLQKLKEEDKQDKVEAIETEITSLKERKDNLDIV